MDAIWNDFEECKSEFEIEIENDTLKEKCKHIVRVSDKGSELCLDCGEILHSLFECCEWNTYTNTDGSYQTNNQRADTAISDNPYSKGGTIPGFNKSSFIMRLHYQQTFTHKQKTYWKTSEMMYDYCTKIGLPLTILPDAKSMWHICMESGKLTRAAVRTGLIGSCIYYACINNNIVADRQKIYDVLEISNKGFLKGERIFMEIMHGAGAYQKLGKQKQDIKENDSFVLFCNKLELPFNISTICNEIFEENKNKLDSVTPKSSTAGILVYVIKNKLKLKSPNKNKISEVVNVCIPTINKVVSLLENKLV